MTTSESTDQKASDSGYTVVARRYRPKDFSELVGQQTIVQALTKAIETHRVGHAYLFTGARGVGKTSSARIFAKALNASADGSGNFDNESDIAQAIDSGEDIDVLEIDGASNRGIDEIRQLRANVAVRPSRSPYKIYIIDEVHMLTTAAFNALLKTLEEPPAHVKFIFCTTDPEKVPITVLSRCQRFDFSPVKTDQILERLRFICKNENATADDEALQLIARRAAGSMRDSQSLLEQMLSFANGHISSATVHSMLGTADETRLATLADAMIARDSAAILNQLDQAVQAGVDAGQLGEQLLGYLRDMMAMGVGGGADLLRTANLNRAKELAKSAATWGTMTLLSAIQILDESLVKMRHSTQSRTLLEVALVQICHLQDLQSLADLLRGLQTGKMPPGVNATGASPSANTPRVAHVPQVGVQSNAPREASAFASPPTSPPSTNVANPAAGKATSSVNPVEPTKPSATTDQSSVNLQASEAEKKKDEQVSPDRIDLSEEKSIHSDPPNEVNSNPPLHATVANAATNAKPSDSDANSANAGDASPSQGGSQLLQQWCELAKHLDGILADYASMAVKVEENSKGGFQIYFPIGCDFAVSGCNQSDHRVLIEQAVEKKWGRKIPVQFFTSNLPPRMMLATGGAGKPGGPNGGQPGNAPAGVSPKISQPQLIRQYAEHPTVKSLIKSIDGEIVRIDVASVVPPAPKVQEGAPEKEAVTPS